MRGTLWLAWRQQRIQIAVGVVVVAACALYVALQRADMTSFIDSHHVALCKGWNGPCVDSPYVLELLYTHADHIRMLGWISAALPVLIGLFWGAPLIGRELESGTYRLALTQGVGPVRWFVSRFGLAALCTVVGSAAFAGLVAWWWAPISNMLDGPYWYDSAIFDATGPAAVAGALFGLAAGTAAGLLVRRVLPAMGVTLVVVLGVRAVLDACRFHLGWLTPLTRTSPGMQPKALIGSARSAGDWGYLTPSGKHEGIVNCEFSGAELKRCMAEHGYVGRFYKVYPSSDFWSLQAIESAVFLVLAVALIALIVVRLRGRRF
ncbi:transporter [Streptomyces sp. NBC_01267]|uniref:transporter n=1 Tax=unclassified Streptomyces TaxID=2593676 RepID=UPI002024B362|nr:MULTISPECIES: transporter [unclassified Streptomyces]WSC21713.1 transporter [Streptomyces sp. NBC_01766]WSV55672.1 transporter [Streptomyces sp. NBC_01014]